MIALAAELGYTVKRNAAHGTLMVLDGFPPLSIAHTPSDVRSSRNLIADLRRRHPDAEIFKRVKADSATRKRRRHRRRVERPEAPNWMPPEPDVEYVRVTETGCVACGRRWLSDLPPAGRSCPDCGEPVLLAGSLVERNQLREAA